jgi:DNA-binding transcriptional ArsR family regulator
MSTRSPRTPKEFVFHAIADPTRRALLDRLRRGEHSVSSLVELFDMTQPAISQHLRVLRDARLVSDRREGQQRFYRLEARPLRIVDDWLAHYTQFWTERLDALGDHLRKKHGPKPRL